MGDEATGLMGVWLLRSAYLRAARHAARRSFLYGENPRGVLILHEGGRMAAIITPSHQTGDAPPPPRKLLAYSGRYRIEPPNRFVTDVDIAWIPSWVGTPRGRNFLASRTATLDIVSDPAPVEFLDGAMAIGVLSWVREDRARHGIARRLTSARHGASRRASISACSASGVADRQAAGLALAQHGDRRRRLGAGRRAAGRPAIVAGRGAARSATGRARASATSASACARGSSSGPSITTEPPRSSMSALIKSERAAAEPLGRAGDCADEVFGRLAPARFVRQMPKPDEDLGEQPDARRRRAVMRLARPRARHVGGVAGGEIDPARAVAEQVQSLGREPSGGVEVAQARRSPRTARARRGPSTHNRRAGRGRRDAPPARRAGAARRRRA